jgi:hypothetical protein
MAEAAMDELTAEGYTLTRSDIVMLNALGWNVETPEHRRLMSRGVPVSVGGAWLWPLTFVSGDWYRRAGCKMAGGVFGGTLISCDYMQIFALAYAMAKGRSRVFGMIECGNAWSMVASWGMSLSVRHDELVEAISQVLAQDQEAEEPPNKNAKPMSAGAASAFLVAQGGGTPDMWERLTSVGYISTMFNAVLQQAQAEGGKGHDPAFLKANKAFGWYCERIRKRGKTNG